MCNRALVRQRVKECFAIAEKRYNRTFKSPTIRFDKRGRVAGTANGGKWELNFNETLLNENLEHFIKQTVGHEVAHLIDHDVYDSHAPRFCAMTGRRKKRASHGENWKRVMRVLGLDPKRCHSYDTTNSRQTRRKQDTFEYKCTGCEKVFPMGKIRHNKQQSGKASYRHCRGSKLLYVGQG